MFVSSYLWSRRWQRAKRPLTYLFAFVILLDVFRLLGAHRTFSNNLVSQTIYHIEDLPREAANQKIYIAAQFWTSEYELVVFWLDQFLKTVLVLGTQNVFVSIIESGSLDNTADAIQWLDNELRKLGVARSIIIDPTTHGELVNSSSIDEHGRPKPGWIKTGQSKLPGQKEMRRIPYLSDLRNWGLEPLRQMHLRDDITFDKILYLNDVYFEPSDILTLLATNGGHYDVACGLDFRYPPSFYDTFALRDSLGAPPIMATFPYFRSTPTRNSMLQGAPARVQSCWNGILAVDAAPYYDQIESTPHQHDPDHLPPTSRVLQTGLRFRGLPDTLAQHHLEASECCLIHADLLASGQAHKGIFVNPAVRTGYSVDAYTATHFGRDKRFVSALRYVTGVWWNRVARWTGSGLSGVGAQDLATVHTRMRKWAEEGALVGETRDEVGDYCTIDEMHILIWNGWKHV